MMSGSVTEIGAHWQQQNYHSLLAEIEVIKASLRQCLSDRGLKSNTGQHSSIAGLHESLNPALRVSQVAKTPTGGGEENSVNPAAKIESYESPKQKSVMLNNLCTLFGLSFFDRQLLILCVAMELDAEISGLCMELTQQPNPSMALALMCFEGDTSAIAPEAPLAYFQLINTRHENLSFVRQHLSISDWTFFYLSGTPILDPALSASLYSVKLTEPMLPTHLKSAKLLGQSRQFTKDSSTAAQVISSEEDDRRQVAALLAKYEEREIYEFNLYHLPLRADEQKDILQRIERAAIARQCLLLIDCQRLVSSEESKADLYRVGDGLACLIQDIPDAILLHAPEQVGLPRTRIHYQYLPSLPKDEQLQLWQHCLQENDGDEIQETLNELTTQYHLTAREVRSIVRSATLEHEGSAQTLQDKLWRRCREQSRQDLAGLAQVISPGALGWDDLVLPEKEKNRLQSIVSQAKQRQRVYDQWGFAKQVSYGLSICALFAGGSGTGKTLAARTIASLLKLDLYHVDLSSIVDKYIGETEKKLDKLFKAAENSGAVLLFDEADALFGKRTKVQDAKDRYANTGVSFLLQRIERYSGLSILTTNMRSAIDSAFTRRLRFIVQFPFPSDKEREKIWQCMIPADAPTKNIDYTKLARLVLAGGAIRNIVLQAAFMAAEHNQAITMRFMYEAVRQEYIKTEKTLDSSLVNDW